MSDPKVTAAPDQGAIRLTMIFNTKSSDLQDVEYESYVSLPVADPSVLHQRLCDDVADMAEETFYPALGEMYEYVTGQYTAAQIESTTRSGNPVQASDPHQIFVMKNMMMKTQACLQNFTMILAALLGPAMPRNATVELENDTRINGRLIPKP